MKERLLFWAGVVLCICMAQWSEVYGQNLGDDANPLAEPKIYRKDIPDKYQVQNRNWQGIPSVEVTKDGNLWMTWYTGGKGEDQDNYVLLITSKDKGETWSKMLLVIDPQDTTRAFDPTLWCDPLGRLWLFWAQSNITLRGPDGKSIPHKRDRIIRDCRAGCWCMICDHPEEGENAVWGEPRRISDGIMLNRPIVDSRGQWLFPISLWRYFSRYPVDERMNKGPNVFITRDQGKTFDFLGFSVLDFNNSRFDEHSLVELRDGRLWILSRTMRGMGEAFSSDGGKTWTETVQGPTIKNASSRCYAMRLQSGNILLVKNGPVNKDIGRNTIMAFLSKDDGKTWSAPLVLDDRKDLTYPGAAQAPDGTIYVTYDNGRHADREIILARFTEDDLNQGKIVSPNSKLKILVSKINK